MDVKENKTPTQSGTESDDEISSIFILKAQANSLTAAENYLRNRNWIVGSGTNLREALAYLIQKNPKYILISADHPNRKVRLLPKMLIQAFPVRVIGFAEKNSGGSTKNLHEMNLEYNLYPPVSGPAIQRMILKIQKDAETREQEALQTKSSRPVGDTSAGGHDLITFKGQTPSEDAVKTSFEQARAALSQLVNADASSADENQQDFSSPSASSSMIKFQQMGGSPSSGTEGPAYRGGPGTDSENQGPSWIPSSKEPPTDGSARTGARGVPTSNIQQGDGASGGSGRFGRSGEGERQEPQGGSLGDSGSSRSSMRSPSPQAHQSNSTSGFQSGPSDWASTPQSQSPFSPSSQTEANSSSGKGKKGAPVMESDYVPKSGPKPYRMGQEKEPQDPAGNQSLFIRGAKKALYESTNLKNAGTASEVTEASHLACILIESPRFSGYLVCAMGRNRKVDQEFAGILRQRLFRFLKDNGEDVREQDSIHLKIQPVDFTAWTLEQAEFLKKSVHDGDEIAIAFFPTTPLSIELQKSVSEKMVMIHINDLKGDAIVEFDLYIFMPENNKYLLYTPQGRPLYGKQRDRLSEKGITHMHLRKEASHEVSRYRAQNFLNDKIDAYKAKLRS